MIIRAPRGLVAVLLAGILWPAPAAAQTAEPPRDEDGGAWAFIGGAAVGFAAHELGHLFFDVVFDADPGVKKVSFAGIPFFAITHSTELSPRQEYTVAASGLWIQNGLNEWILSRRPDIRHEHAPFQKGVLAMNLATSVIYSGAALFKIGPAERDTRAMAGALGVDERWIGVLVLVPAVLDTYRYFHPEATWAAWSARGVKMGMVLLVLK
jgi:hypothetical protein